MASGEAGWQCQGGVITAEGGAVQSGLSVAGVRGEEQPKLSAGLSVY